MAPVPVFAAGFDNLARVDSGSGWAGARYNPIGSNVGMNVGWLMYGRIPPFHRSSAGTSLNLMSEPYYDDRSTACAGCRTSSGAVADRSL
jgi:hypothetical protein